MLVFFIILLMVILIYLSGVSIKIDNLELEKKEKLVLRNFKLNIYLMIFNKVKILKLTIRKEQIEKINFDKILDRFKGKSLKQDRNIISQNLEELKIEVEELKLNAKLGLNNAIFLAYLTAIFNIFLSIFYAKIVIGNKENYKYKIEPYQTNKFYLKLSINCIIKVKIANIINMIIKNRSDVENERTSNRIFNGNCYGQYTRYGGCKHYYRSTN